MKFRIIGLGVMALLISMKTISGASGSINGTVKVVGAASSANTVVYIQQLAGSFAPKSVVMDQRGMQFVPTVLPIVVGTKVRFLNNDPTPHNVFTPDNEKYNLGTWPQGQSKDYVFAKCTKTPCVYTQLCRVHPEMEGYVVVLQNPFFAVTDKSGHYEITNVPPGVYTLGVWNQKGKAPAKSVIVESGKPVTTDFTIKK